MSDSIKLNVTQKRDGSKWRLNYSIENRSEESIFACVLAADAAMEVYPHQAYCCLSDDKESLLLLIGETPPPEDIVIGYRAQAFSAKISSLDTYKNWLELSLPIGEWHAYQDAADPETAKTIQVKRFSLKIEYALAREAYFVDDSPLKHHFQVGAFPVRELMFYGELEEPIEVLLNDIDFERFSF